MQAIPRPGPNTINLLCLSAAIVAVSFAAIFIRWSEQEIDGYATTFNRLWIATLVLGLWQALPSRAKRPPVPAGDAAGKSGRYILLVLGGVFSAASVACWAWSLSQTHVANATVLRSLTPIFTSLGGWLLLGRCFDRRFLLGMAIAIGGAILIGWDDWEVSATHLSGDGVALLSAAFYAGNLLIVEYLRNGLGASTILLWRCGVGSVALCPVVVYAGNPVFPSTGQGWLAVIALGTICQILGQGLMAHTLKKLSSGFVSVFLLLEPVLAALLAWVFFGETLDLLNFLAFFLILLGINLALRSQSATKA
ncbi:DMT family transporter [Methylomagnum ishizawai]|uniref:DMT family transporter n=1 Tax=Methylomagnum ishizawai TaxID=1760988 RepID=UPI001C320DBF|nr:DMT family transporter [Methylomagnum ishizawai]BBL76287.1 membrane protein [Methylomagnum ishizawai]